MNVRSFLPWSVYVCTRRPPTELLGSPCHKLPGQQNPCASPLLRSAALCVFRILAASLEATAQLAYMQPACQWKAQRLIASLET